MPVSFRNGKLILDIAFDIAVCTFNDGLCSIMKIMEVLGMTMGRNCYNFYLKADAMRVMHAELVFGGGEGRAHERKIIKKRGRGGKSCHGGAIVWS